MCPVYVVDCTCAGSIGRCVDWQVCGLDWQVCGLFVMIACLLVMSPRVGSGVVRIDPLRFLAGCRKSQLNQSLSVLSFSLGFSDVVLLTRDFLCCVICVFCLLVVLIRLSVPVQVIDWKDSSLK